MTSSSRSRFFSPLIFLFLISVLLLIGRFVPSVAKVEDRILHAVFLPLRSGISLLKNGVSDLWRHYFFLVSVAKENEVLKKELVALKSRIEILKMAEGEAKRLSDLLQLRQTQTQKFEVARVVAYDPIPASNSLLIDKGTQDGIEVGQVVASHAGIVGMVVKPFEKDAQVLLINDPQMVVAAEVLPSGARGILKGEHRRLGLNRSDWITRLEYLNASDLVSEGNLVVSSGLDRVFAKGLVLGRVIRVSRDEKGLFLAAEVVPEVDLKGLREVRVLLR